MIDFVCAHGVALTFLRDETKVRSGPEAKALWRDNGLFRARLKLRDAMMNIQGLQWVLTYVNWIA